MYFPVLHLTCLFLLIFFLPSPTPLVSFFFLSLLLLKHVHVPPSTSFLSSSNPLLFLSSSFRLSYPPLPLQAGKIPPNSTVGRLLMEMVSRVPKIEGPKFDSMLNATMQASIMSCVWHVAMATVTDMYGSVAVLCRN